MKITTKGRWQSMPISVETASKPLRIQFNVIINLALLILCISCNDKPTQEIRGTKSRRVFNEQELQFNDGIYKFNAGELNQWSELEKAKIKKITFESFDSIPIVFELFTNVETLKLGYRRNIYVPDIFPNLKRIELFSCDLTIEKNARFKKTLTEIDGEKAKIKSIDSFDELPNLRKIALGYSKFNPFPKDLNKLQNLEEILLYVYMGHLDVTDLGISELKMLKKAVFHTYSENTIIGFPKDILKIDRNIELEISHPGLTKEQKTTLKRFKKLSF
jgi:hypothetical protein